MLSRVTNFCVIFPIFPEYFDQGYKNISASGPLTGTRYICTYEEFVLETEAPRCDRMTASGQDTDNKNNNIQIFKIDNVQVC